jgi:hypothetical protein
MSLREPRRSVDRHNLHAVWAGLDAARKLLEWASGDEDDPARRQEKLRNAAAELDRASAIAESYFD